MRRNGGKERRQLAMIALATRAYGRSRSPARRELAEAADRALRRSSDDEKEIFRLEFVEGMDGKMVSESCKMSIASYYRARRRLLERVADEVG